MESSLNDFAIRTVKVTLLSLLPNVASSLSLASALCSCIKERIVLASKKKGDKKREKKKGSKGGKITTYTSHLA